MKLLLLACIPPENYLSKKLLSKIKSAIEPEINITTYSSSSSFSLSGGSFDVVVGRDSSIENLIDEEKLLELNNDLISNKTFIDKKFLTSSFDPERKVQCSTIIWGHRNSLQKK